MQCSCMAQDPLSSEAGLCSAKPKSLLSVFMQLMFPLDRKHFTFVFFNLSFIPLHFYTLSISHCMLRLFSKLQY